MLILLSPAKSLDYDTPVPAHLAAKVAHALEAPVDELVERGVVPSGEVLAQVLPQITADVLAIATNPRLLHPR